MEILFISPGIVGGGWNAIRILIQKILKSFPLISVKIIGAGPIAPEEPLLKEKKVKILNFPWLNYDNYANLLEKYVILNCLFNLPLLIFTLYMAFKNKEKVKVIVCNGLMSFLGIFFLKFFRILNSKVYVWIHTDLQFSKKRIIKKIFLYLQKYIDFFWANSKDVKNDLIKCGILETKIKVIPNAVEINNIEKHIHYKEKLSFLNKYSFKILYAGRFVDYKHILMYLKIAKKLANQNICFVFIGDGQLLKDVQKIVKSNNHIYYIGRLSNLEVRNLYFKFNLTLAYADETYVSMTALESLAAGTPVLYPDISSSPAKFRANVKIKKELLPNPIGWKVNADVDSFIKATTHLYMQNFPSIEVRKKCKEYIKKNHSENNFKIIIESIFNYV